MELAKSGHINDFCQPNSILTFKENLIDYADEITREKGEEVIEKALCGIKNEQIRELALKKLKEIENGARDLYL